MPVRPTTTPDPGSTTFGRNKPTGSRVRRRGGAFTCTSGALFGGRDPGVPDDASTVLTAERRDPGSDVANANVLSVDSGFSFNVMTNARATRRLRRRRHSDADRSQGTPAPVYPRQLERYRERPGKQRVTSRSERPARPMTITVAGTRATRDHRGGDPRRLDRRAALATLARPSSSCRRGADASATGLTITAGNTVVRGFVIDAFSGRGISIPGAGGNLITGNYIGTDSTGVLDRGNALSGIFLDNSAGNTIGGLSATERNLISGNDLDGAWVTSAGASNNQILGNYIGVNAAGAAPIGNSESAIDIDTGASGNVVRGNALSGNAQYGVDISDAATTLNVIAGNTIGLDAGGTVSIANALGGVVINAGAANNTIGGTTAGTATSSPATPRSGCSSTAPPATWLRATTSAPTVDRDAGAWATPTTACASPGGATGNTIGGTAAAARNVISGNLLTGIQHRGSDDGQRRRGQLHRPRRHRRRRPWQRQDGHRHQRRRSNTIGGDDGRRAQRHLRQRRATGCCISGSSATRNLVVGQLHRHRRRRHARPGQRANGIGIENGVNANTVGGTTAGSERHLRQRLRRCRYPRRRPRATSSRATSSGPRRPAGRACKPRRASRSRREQHHRRDCGERRQHHRVQHPERRDRDRRFHNRRRGPRQRDLLKRRDRHRPGRVMPRRRTTWACSMSTPARTTCRTSLC